MWEGVQSYLPFHPVGKEVSREFLPLLLGRISKHAVLDTSIDREAAGSVSCHFPSCRHSRRSFQIARFIDISSAALRWGSLGATGWLPGPSPAVFPLASALGAVASRGVGSQGDAAPGQTQSSPVGFGAGWGRFSQHSPTLGPYKIGCPSPVVLTKAGPF